MNERLLEGSQCHHLQQLRPTISSVLAQHYLLGKDPPVRPALWTRYHAHAAAMHSVYLANLYQQNTSPPRRHYAGGTPSSAQVRRPPTSSPRAKPHRPGPALRGDSALHGPVRFVRAPPAHRGHREPASGHSIATGPSRTPIRTRKCCDVEEHPVRGADWARWVAKHGGARSQHSARRRKLTARAAPAPTSGAHPVVRRWGDDHSTAAQEI